MSDQDAHLLRIAQEERRASVPRRANRGTTDLAAYEVYVRLTTPDGPFFKEIRGDTLPSTQIDVGTVSKFVRDQAASAVRVDALWFERAAATD